MYGVQSYHPLLCDALGLDSSWYGVPSAQKRKGLSDPLNVGLSSTLSIYRNLRHN